MKMFRNRYRWIVFLLLFVLGVGLVSPMALAAGGSIRDEADLFSASEENAIQRAIDQAGYSFHLYTVDRLNGQEIGALAKERFQSWSLGSNDVLMVIAEEDREVALEAAIEGSVDRAIMAASEFSGQDPYNSLLEVYFIPHAANGDFVQAVTSVIHKFDSLIVNIHDHANLFSDAEKNTIQQAISQASFSFHLYTVSSLNGQDINAFGTELFESWSLGSRDVLMVIALEEREVALEVDIGGIIDRAILSSNEFSGNDPLASLLDAYFIPYAADGNFVQAVTSVIKKIDDLVANLNHQAPIAGGGNHGSVTQPSGTPQSETTTISFEDLKWLIFGGLILLAAVGLITLIVIKWAQRGTLAKQYKMMLAKHQDTLGIVHKVEQDIKPLAQLTLGESRKRIQDLKERHYQLLQASTDCAGRLESFKVPAWTTKKMERRLAELQKQVDVHHQTATEIQSELQQFQELEREMTRLLEATLKDYEEAVNGIKQLVTETKHASVQLVKRSEELRQILDRCKESITFDPLTVKQLLEYVPEQAKRLKEDVHRLRRHAQAYSEMPQRLDDFKKKLDQLIQTEKLICTEIAPYAFYSRTDEQLGRWGSVLQEGNVEESSNILNQLNNWMEEAMDQVSRTIEARNWCRQTLDEVKLQRSLMDEGRIAMLRWALDAVKQAYDRLHWQTLQTKLDQIEPTLAEVDRKLADVSDWMLPNMQKYFRAQQTLQQLQQQLQEMEQTASTIQNVKGKLDASYQQLVTQSQEQRAFMDQMNEAIVKYQLQNDHPIPTLVQDARYRLDVVANLLQQRPRNLEAIHQAVQMADEALRHLDNMLQQAIRAYHEAVNQLHAFERQYREAYGRYKALIRKRYYKDYSNRLIASMSHAIAIHDYHALHTFIQHGHQLIAQMQQEYNATLMQHRDMHRPPGGFGGFGGGGGTRSGGSGWGGSSTRSSSSSWSSGSGTRSGSSGWGGGSGGGGSKGGGSRGGSAKW